MTVSPPVPFPGSRVVAGWWRELAPYQPHALSVVHAVLHRVDAPVQLIHSRPLHPLAALLLNSLPIPAAGGIARLAASLGLTPAFIFRSLADLKDEGFVFCEHDAWVAAPSAQAALDRGQVELVRLERRVFAFLAPFEGSAARFVQLITEPGDAVATPAPDIPFDPRALLSCFERSAEWKRTHGFPLDASLPTEGAEWRRVIVDLAERVVLAVIRSEAVDGDEMAFWVEPAGWRLESRRPAFRLDEPERQDAPVLVSETPSDHWRRAWHDWCHPRNLPAVEVDRCSVKVVGHRLIVQSSRRLIDRLRLLRSDALKGEAWILAGDGLARQAALLEIAQAEPEARPSLGPPTPQ
jgi:hypothetical protein